MPFTPADGRDLWTITPCHREPCGCRHSKASQLTFPHGCRHSTSYGCRLSTSRDLTAHEPTARTLPHRAAPGHARLDHPPDAALGTAPRLRHRTDDPGLV